MFKIMQDGPYNSTRDMQLLSTFLGDIISEGYGSKPSQVFYYIKDELPSYGLQHGQENDNKVTRTCLNNWFQVKYGGQYEDKLI